MSIPIYTSNSISTSSNSSTITWGGNHTHNVPGGIPWGSYTTSAPVFNPTTVTIDIKRCRNCNHAHLAEQTGCIDQEGWNTIFVTCPCKEYVPSDNLEYLEYLDKKKEQK